MPLPRFRLRTLMIAVAMVAMSFGRLRLILGNSKDGSIPWDSWHLLPVILFFGPVCDWATLRLLYWSITVALRPWLPVTPDPPPPK